MYKNVDFYLFSNNFFENSGDTQSFKYFRDRSTLKLKMLSESCSYQKYSLNIAAISYYKLTNRIQIFVFSIDLI